MTPLQNRIDRARSSVIALFRWQRVLGLAATAVVFYFVIFVVFGRTDMNWALPRKVAHFSWPDLPRFLVWTQKAPDGQDEAVYTVPARQLTREEVSQLGPTNAAPTSPSAR
jgi:hypothetical protein